MRASFATRPAEGVRIADANAAARNNVYRAQLETYAAGVESYVGDVTRHAVHAEAAVKASVKDYGAPL